MTNEEAIKILKPIFEHCKGKNGCLGYIEHFFTKDEEEALQMAIKALESQRWILCDERLPEEFQCVLVTTSTGTDVCTYLKGSAYWKSYVLAWMPLPTPYKEKNNGE